MQSSIGVAAGAAGAEGGQLCPEFQSRQSGYPGGENSPGLRRELILTRYTQPAELRLLLEKLKLELPAQPSTYCHEDRSTAIAAVVQTLAVAGLIPCHLRVRIRPNPLRRVSSLRPSSA